jgi:hypothetical protein
MARMLVQRHVWSSDLRPGELPDTLLERADQALLDAKHRAPRVPPTKTLEPDRRALQTEPAHQDAALAPR